MSGRFTTIPTYEQSLTEKGNTARPWYVFFQNLYTGNPPAAESTITPTASPFTYTAARKGFLIVQGGTLGLVSFSRGGVTNHNTGATQGAFPLSAGDSLVITYTAAPTLTFVPQ